MSEEREHVRCPYHKNGRQCGVTEENCENCSGLRTAYAQGRADGRNEWVSVTERLPKRGKINPSNTTPQCYLQIQHGRIVWEVIWLDLIEEYGMTHWLDWNPPAPPVALKKE